MASNTKSRIILTDRAQRSVNRAWNRFADIYGNKIGKAPIVKINARLKTTAGRAWINDGIIDLSLSLYDEFKDQFESNTIPHECAHFVAYRVFNEANHGRAWKDVMVAYGIEPAVYHDYLEQRMIRKFK